MIDSPKFVQIHFNDSTLTIFNQSSAVIFKLPPSFPPVQQDEERTRCWWEISEPVSSLCTRNVHAMLWPRAAWWVHAVWLQLLSCHFKKCMSQSSKTFGTIPNNLIYVSHLCSSSEDKIINNLMFSHRLHITGSSLEVRYRLGSHQWGALVWIPPYCEIDLVSESQDCSPESRCTLGFI